MPIALNCPRCENYYQFSDELAGLAVRCKQCGRAIEVPSGPSTWLGPSRAANLLAAARRPGRKSNQAFAVSASIGAACALALALVVMLFSMAFRHRLPVAAVQSGGAWGSSASRVAGPAPEALAKEMVAVYDDAGRALSQVVDAKSADIQATVVATKLKRGVELAAQLDAVAWDPAEKRRLHLQLDAGNARLKSEMTRINGLPEAAAVLRRRLQWENLTQGISRLAEQSRRKGRNPGQAPRRFNSRVRDL